MACTGCCATCTREFGLTSVIATHNPRLAAGCDRMLQARGRPPAAGVTLAAPAAGTVRHRKGEHRAL